MQGKSFASVEGLRAWMAWWVVVAHGINLVGVPAWVPKKLETLLTRADVAVNVFIVVSGFVITHLMLTKREAYAPYLVRRFFRLMPVYLVCLAVALLTVIPYLFSFGGLGTLQETQMRWERVDSTEDSFLQHLVLHLTMLHGAVPESVLPYAGTSILAPAWSLSLEWQFYLIAPFVILAMSRSLTGLLAVVIGAFTLQYVSTFFLAEAYQEPSLLMLSLGYFMVGILTRMALHLNIKGVVIAVALAYLIKVSPLVGLVWSLWVLFIASEAGLLSDRISGVVNRLRASFATNLVITSLGRWSYSTYLVHIPLMAVAIYFGSASFKEQAFPYVLLSMAVLPAVSWFLYTFVEKPGISLGARIASAMTKGAVTQTLQTN